VDSLLPFLVAGLTTGSVYGIAGLGLVLTYKTSRIFNFAHGALATIAAFLFYSLHVTHGMSWPLAAGICVLVAGPVLGYAFELLGRVITGKALAIRVASTVGILLGVQAVVSLIYDATETRTVLPFLGNHVYHFGDTAVTQDKLIVWIIGLLATIALSVLFRYTRVGLAMRASVDDVDLLNASGTSPTKVRRLAWMIGVSFAALSGVLIAPLVTLDGVTLTLLVVQAFGAAAIGRFSSLPGTYVGGLIIGVGGALLSKYFTTGVLAGLPTALPFLLLFIVLLVSPRARLAERTVSLSRFSSQWRFPGVVQLGGGAAVLVLLILVPNFAGFHLTDWTLLLTTTILFLSLGLLVRSSGQVSLCHVGFTAIGAAAFSHLAVDHGLPWLVALVLSALIAVPIGAVLAIPAIRLSGLYLALATLGFGILLAYMFYTQSYMFGELGAGIIEPRPHLSWVNVSSDKGYYYLVLAITVLMTAFTVWLVRSRLGRLLRALSDSPTGLASTGTSVNVTRVLVFCISSFMAAGAGALAGGAVSTVTADSYQPLASLTYYALIVIALGGEPWYALMAAAGLTLIPSYIHGDNTSLYLQLIFGAAALLISITPASLRTVPKVIRDLADGLARGTRRPLTAQVGPYVSIRPKVEAATLSVGNVTVRFGGLVAVDSASLEASTGKITGLIGPNGAGKTTTLNVCSALIRPSGGNIRLDGKNVSRQRQARRARGGIGRTFQQMELFDSMTVRENVALGVEGSFAGPNPISHSLSTRSQRRWVQQSTDDSLRLCELEDLADKVAGDLSTGQRRRVELARTLAGPFRILLLDEPSSGLDRAETRRFGAILKRIVKDRGVGILLVEHDMALVNEICDYIYVLDFGKPVYDGTPSQVMASPLVRSAYLGGDAVEDAVLEGSGEAAS
jgi:ABC-type branched-subunit amino acid transport system ATPase component/branched-subunit amino acid ABC-type transport system permease component